MINTLSLLFGLFGVILVTVRAVTMDRMLPWFKPVQPPAAASKPALRTP